jgi:hypothetical protein
VGGITGAALFRAAALELSACDDEISEIHSTLTIETAVMRIGHYSVLVVIPTGR